MADGAPHSDSWTHLRLRTARCAEYLPSATVRLPWGRVEFDMVGDPLVTLVDADPQSASPALLSEAVSAEEVDRLVAPLRRLALTRWLERWSPYLPRPDVAELDAAVACREAGRSYEAFVAFDRRSQLLLDLLSWQADRALPAGLVADVRSCAESALFVLGNRHRVSARLRHALEAQQADHGIPAMVPNSLIELERWFPRSRSLARTLGTESVPGFPAPDGAALVSADRSEHFDWVVCHPRRSSLVGPDFQWRQDRKQVRVILLSERVANLPDPLVVRIGRARGDVLAEAPIAPWQGSSATVPVPAGVADLVVEVAELRHHGPMAIGPERQRRTAGREATRGLVLRRAAEAASDLSHEAAAELDEAAAEAFRSMEQLVPQSGRGEARGLSRAVRQHLAHAGEHPSRPTLSEYVAAAQSVGLAPP